MKRFDFLETRYRSIIVSWVLIFCGLIALAVGNEVSARGISWWGVNVGNNIVNIGSLVGIIGLMQWSYDAFARRKFFEEVITSVSGTRAIYDIGIVDAQQTSSEADLKDEIRHSSSLSIMFSHSKRFVDRYHQSFVDRTISGKETTVYLDDKDSNAIRYYISCGRSQGYLHENIDEFVRVLKGIDGGRGLICIKMIDVMPKYAFIRSDRMTYFIFSTTSEGQVTVPLVAIRRDTPFWDFVTRDIAHIEEKHIKQVIC